MMSLLWQQYTSQRVIVIIILIILWVFLRNLPGLRDSCAVVTACGLMDNDSQGPSEGETALQLQVLEDLSFFVTEIFFM